MTHDRGEDPRVRRLPAGQGGHQRRPGQARRHQRRVDQDAGRHPSSGGSRADDETVADMAEAAGAKALAASGLEPSDIDLVIVATCSPESPMPNVVGHRRLPARHRRARARTTSTPPAPGSATRSAPRPTRCARVSARNALVIGAEKMTSWMDWTDRSTCIIFADGAGAAVVGPTADGEPSGIGPDRLGQRGRPGAQDRDRGADREADPGRAGRVPLGDHRAGPGGARGVPPGRGDAGRHLGLHPAPGEPADHRGASPRSSASPGTASPTTSSRPGTPRPRRSRSRCPGWPSRGGCSRARRRCCSAFGAGLSYAAQVVTVP